MKADLKLTANLDKTEIVLNGSKLGLVSYTINYHTRTHLPGTHTLTAVGIDESGTMYDIFYDFNRQSLYYNSLVTLKGGETDGKAKD